MVENSTSDLEKYLSQYQVEGVVRLPGSRTYSFPNGEELLPIKELVLPKLVPLWADALNREETDTLVVEDSSKYPFEAKNRVMLVEDANKEFAAVFLYHPVQYKEVAGLGLGICLVPKRYQGHGLMNQLIADRIGAIKPRFLSCHTQNQMMVAAVRKFCPQGYLYPIDGQIPEDVVQMGKDMSPDLEKYDSESMVERGFYCKGNPLYGDRQEWITKDQSIRYFFARHVDFQKGDSIRIIGFIPQNGN